jgi:hypothetical protein
VSGEVPGILQDFITLLILIWTVDSGKTLNSQGIQEKGCYDGKGGGKPNHFCFSMV